MRVRLPCDRRYIDSNDRSGFTISVPLPEWVRAVRDAVELGGDLTSLHVIEVARYTEGGEVVVARTITPTRLA